MKKHFNTVIGRWNDVLTQPNTDVLQRNGDVYVHEDGKIVFTVSELKTGTTTTNKRWYRWSRHSVLSVQRSKAGFLYARQGLHEKNRGFRWSNYGAWALKAALSQDHTRHWASEVVDHETWHMIEDYRREACSMPLRYHYTGIASATVADIPESLPLYRFFQHDNVRDATRTLFGSHNYRKDLVKAVAEAKRTDAIIEAAAFRDLVPVDWIIGYLKIIEEPPYAAFRRGNSIPNVEKLRRVLRNVEQKNLKRMLNDPLSSFLYVAPDITKWAYLPPETYAHARTRGELHDFMMRADRQIGREKLDSATFKPSALAKKIDKAFEGTAYTHVIGDSYRQFLGWSEEMNNCVSSYYSNAAANRCVIGGIYKNGKILSNYEVRGGSLNQLLGKHNKHLPKEDHDALVTILGLAGVDASGDYWGKYYHTGVL